MNQVNQGNDYNLQPNMPVKRKRGRPRKDQSLNPGKDALVPPGFGGVNGNQSRQIISIEDANAGIVGQAVTGVVEAAFDAGYLLNVKIGNSKTSLRGVVFKPGHFVPISAENDVAPHAQMIRRNEIPLPTENQARVLGRHPRSRGRKEHHGNLRRIEMGHLLNGFPSANQVHRLAPQTADLAASKGKQVSPVSAYGVPSVGSRGTVVPVVLLPVSVPNGFLPLNQMPPIPSRAGHMAALKHEQVETVTSQVPPLQPQSSHQVMSEDLQNDPTPDEVNRRVQVFSQSSETHIGNSMAAGKSSAEDSGISLEGDSDDMNEPVSVEPLQAIRSDIPNQSGLVPKPSENFRIGRMSALLQALQENMMENQLARVENPAMETDRGDEETV